MRTKNTILIFLSFVFLFFSCDAKTNLHETDNDIVVGANQTTSYLHLLKDKRVGLVANQTSVIFNKKNTTHLVDSLLSLGVNITKVFAPEHGFRGKADAGEYIKNSKDAKTGIDIISIYGENRKPFPNQLANIDIMVFDIQDVGARFYTYISSLHYIMEACAEQNIPLLILDRPNPNGHYADGPILELEHKSFVGMHPIPVVHGMTIGEYAKMINGENWLKNKIQCYITIIPCKNYSKNMPYDLPIKPSPNLPNAQAINMYPSLCFFEGTPISVGRGTDMQFQIYGAPNLPKTKFTFTPKPNEGAKSPKHNGKTCNGRDLRNIEKLSSLNLEWLIAAYKNRDTAKPFFTKFFTKLAGTKKLQNQIENGVSINDIKASWKDGLEAYQKMRTPYLIYKNK